VIYLDSSVALAHLLAEPRKPAESLWRETCVSSRLLEYEIWSRLHARRLGLAKADEVRGLLDRVGLIELEPSVLARALQPFPVQVRTLDGLHLATIVFLQANGQQLELASYDERLVAAAGALGIGAVEI
jgi:hypothetical protein